jgi:hypothetical protein
MVLALGAGLALRRRGMTFALRRPLLRPASGEGQMWADPPAWRSTPPDPVRGLPWPQALAVALVAGAVGGFLFAVRAGVVIAPVTFVLLVAGITARRLLAAAGAALVAVTFAYVVSPSPNAGGFYFYYALHYITAHWIALAAVCLLGTAAGLMAWDSRTAADRSATEGGIRPGWRGLQALMRRLRVGRRPPARR